MEKEFNKKKVASNQQKLHPSENKKKLITQKLQKDQQTIKQQNIEDGQCYKNGKLCCQRYINANFQERQKIIEEFKKKCQYGMSLLIFSIQIYKFFDGQKGKITTKQKYLIKNLIKTFQKIRNAKEKLEKLEKENEKNEKKLKLTKKGLKNCQKQKESFQFFSFIKNYFGFKTPKDQKNKQKIFELKQDSQSEDEQLSLLQQDIDAQKPNQMKKQIKSVLNQKKQN